MLAQIAARRPTHEIRAWRVHDSVSMDSTQLQTATVGPLMRRHFVKTEVTESLLEVDRIMRLARIRHLPVVENGLLVGILSHRDVAEAALSRIEGVDGAKRIEHLRRIKVADVMRRDVSTAEEGTSLGDAARRMLGRKIGCLVVIRHGARGDEAIGLITESDLLRAAYARDFAGACD